MLCIPASVPTMNKKVKIQVFDYDLIGDSDLIGTIYLDFSKLRAGSYIEPAWYNMYGPNVGVDNDQGRLMLTHGELGSHYRGRILIAAEGCKDPHPKSHKK